VSACRTGLDSDAGLLFNASNIAVIPAKAGIHLDPAWFTKNA
jgi:hypothetical protein